LKFIAVILSVYILCLTAIPCHHEHGTNNQQTLSIEALDGHHHHNQADPCSPFCSCTYCQTLFETSPEDFFLAKPVGYGFDIPFILSIHNNPIISFWRPPKI